MMTSLKTYYLLAVLVIEMQYKSDFCSLGFLRAESLPHESQYSFAFRANH
jgi:hypothetical protein